MMDLKKRMPYLTFEYAPDYRQAIADGWPASIDDCVARQDWNWNPKFSMEAMIDDMISRLGDRLHPQSM